LNKQIKKLNFKFITKTKTIMNTLNFSTFSAQKTANTRSDVAGVPRGQSFKLKFRRFLKNTKGEGDTKVRVEDTTFVIANDKFKELNLAELGLIQLNAPIEQGVFLATVPNNDATMLKRTDKLKDGAEKGKKFKSTILEAALIEAGLISAEQKTYFLDLELVGEDVEVDGIKAKGIYKIVEGEGEDTDEDKAEDDKENLEEIVQDEAPLTSNTEENNGIGTEQPSGTATEAATNDDF
jgi:hypothetical protein